MAKQKPQRKPPASSSPSQQSAAKSAGGFRGIDPNFAVEAAAALMSARNKGVVKPGAKKESLEFRLLKEGINDPGTSSIDSILDKSDTTVSKRSGTPFQANRAQVGHNQTFGPDATRTGVPRRTGG